MIVQGRALLVGDDVDTDAIIPAKYLVTADPTELGRHCLEGLDPGFPGRIRPGDILVAGENFGCDSSREHAVLALRGAGIACVVAKSFARIFFRNAVNLGFPSCYIRPLVFRGLGSFSLDARRDCPVEVAILTIEWGAYLGTEALEQGVDVGVSTWARMAPNTYPSLAKAGGHYTNSQLIVMEAHDRGFSEGIALDVFG